MKIKNVGKARYSTGAELIPYPDSDDVVVVGYGQTVDVPDEYGAALCAEQPDSFQEVTETKPKKGS